MEEYLKPAEESSSLLIRFLSPKIEKVSFKYSNLQSYNIIQSGFTLKKKLHFKATSFF